MATLGRTTRKVTVTDWFALVVIVVIPVILLVAKMLGATWIPIRIGLFG